ncbi:amino acid/polyamine/organocation transporter, APC superfamily [Cnuella takakiae]|uniref:Amino acid/polyamine/organocation transporter, APC superfamily n=1 Tax=Cnuella takakiae TaxID=1302690 RepID=A0A1M5E3T8_9BACT|nr:APC family permease [Cnuella takakiae]OLY93787.1 serine/threonine protein kinase [Cnuella takakiae]SHF73855.1 amino acid/polyamine/organocation transporter, APC superfamily [Cnuella takakiae]
MSQRPQLGLFDLTMIVIGLVIGMGIFRTASDAASAAITPSVFFAAWIGGGLVALCGALTYAEIGSRFPITGGYYKVFAECYHPSIAFAINCIILISNAASMSGVALIGAEYFAQAFFHEAASDTFKSFLAMGAIALFYGVNLLGLRMSSKTQNVLMMIKIGMLVLLISSLFVLPAADAPAAVTGQRFTALDYIKSFGVALIAVSFTYGGYQQTINFGDEVREPRRTIPRGIFIGIVCIIGLYLLVNFAYYRAIGFEELKTSRGIAAIVAGRMLGPTGNTIFSFLLFFAVLAYVNVLLLSNPRVMYAMSTDGILPQAFAKRNIQKDVLTTSLTAFAAIGIIVLFFAKTFDRILGFTIFLDCIGMATSAATIFILRKRTKHLDGTGIYQMKAYPIMPLIFIAAYLFVGISIWISTPELAWTAIAVFAAFLVLYFLVKGRK